MPSTPNDRDRFYQPKDLDDLLAYIDDEGARTSHRDGLLSCLSWTVARLKEADDPKDVHALESQIMRCGTSSTAGASHEHRQADRTRRQSVDRRA